MTFQKRQQRNYRQKPMFEKIHQPLAIHYQNKADLYLENGIAHNAARNFKYIASHQLRKILNQSKQCISKIENKEHTFQDVANLLYATLPLAAYNAGREKNLKPLYEFLAAHINQNTITCDADIQVFDELFTSVVAYHKFVDKYERGKNNVK